jgi:MFS family permease
MAISQGITMAAMGFGMIPSGFLVDAWGYHWSFYISFGISTLAGIILITGLKALSRLKNKLPVAYPRPTAELLFHDKLNSNRAITLQFVVSGLLHLGYGISITFLPLLATQVVGTTTGAVGILFAIASLSAASLVIPMGMLADRKGKRIFMILGLLVSASSLTGIAFTTTFSWLVVFFITFELGIAMFNPAALALLSDKVLLRRQSTVMGFYGAIGENSGIFAGSAMAGFAWSALGSQITFLIGATACGLGAIISLIFIREKTSKSHNSGILAP